jgi:putative cardiolipin synthase
MKAFIWLLLLFCFQAVAEEQSTTGLLLSDSIPYPYFSRMTEGNHQVMHLPEGVAAMQLRLEMIRRATKNIEVEYFIYNDDVSGKILTRELIAAAQRGVKVRILIDKCLPVFLFDKFYAKAVAEYGIEVRYYNSAPLIAISSVQFRNHRKLLSVDDEEAITGGRNIGDDYFDLSPHFNFNDTDIYVKGPIVKVIRESFDAYFEHKISERPKFPQPREAAEGEDPEEINKSYFKKTSEVEAFLQPSEEEARALRTFSTIGKRQLEATKLHQCPEITYVTDAPGANFWQRINPRFEAKYKFVRKTLFDKLSRVEKRLIISSPYLISNPHSSAMMKSLLKRGVKISAYTNSLASTDAVYVAANMYFEAFGWIKRGVDVHVHDGLYTDETPELDEAVKNARWGTHSKVQVYENNDSSEIMIGTYNIDNRSNFYNSEMAIFCKGNDELSKEVSDNIFRLKSKGIQLNADRTATDRHGNTRSIWGHSKKDLFLMKAIFLPAWLLRFLL